MRLITFVYPVIRDDFINKSLETLFKYTEPTKFNVIIVDQSLGGIGGPWISKVLENGGMVINMKNQGFAKAANEGMIHGLRWGSPYISVVNDDTEFMYAGWLEDLLEEFKSDERIIAVGPESPRVAMWGYGMTNGEYVDILPYKEVYTPQDIEYLKSGNYDEAEIRARHPFQIPSSFPFTKRGVIDGMAMWCPVFKREGLLEIGLYDERFVWGGGEDYSMVARAYSCAWPIDRNTCDEKYHKRMISTMKSWTWHWWGKSKDEVSKLDPKLFEGRKPWNNLDELWPPDLNGGNHVDPWAHWTDKDGTRRPFRRIKQIYIHQP